MLPFNTTSLTAATAPVASDAPARFRTAPAATTDPTHSHLFPLTALLRQFARFVTPQLFSSWVELRPATQSSDLVLAPHETQWRADYSDFQENFGMKGRAEGDTFGYGAVLSLHSKNDFHV